MRFSLSQETDEKSTYNVFGVSYLESALFANDVVYHVQTL